MASFSQTDLEEPWNTLMFPTSFLCQNVQNGLAKIELSTKLNDIERLIANLSSAGSLEKKIGTLFDINRTITGEEFVF